MDMVVVAISGEPGCGSTTTGKMLSEKLGLDFFSVGHYFKSFDKGEETEKTVRLWKSSVGRKLQTKKGNVIPLETMQIGLAKKGNLVIDAKLAVRFLKNHADLRVWLKAPLSVRAARCAKRDKISLAKAESLVSEKERLERENWKKIYGFDFFDQEKEADIVIDVSSKTPEQIVDIIASKIRRVFIVHGWEGAPEKDWYPYVKNELEKRGYAVAVLSMPSPDLPIIKRWVAHLSEKIGKPTQNTFLIGHSAGVMTILRYLEQLPKNKKVGGCILVAGWIDDLGYKELRNFCVKPVNWKKIRQHCRKFVAIHSDNDPYVKMYHGYAFKKNLGAKLIIEHNKGHITDEDGIKKLPSVVKNIMSL